VSATNIASWRRMNGVSTGSPSPVHRIGSSSPHRGRDGSQSPNLAMRHGTVPDHRSAYAGTEKTIRIIKLAHRLCEWPHIDDVGDQSLPHRGRDLNRTR